MSATHDKTVETKGEQRMQGESLGLGKFIQITAVPANVAEGEREPRLFALDELGYVWAYDGSWSRLPHTREVPR